MRKNSKNVLFGKMICIGSKDLGNNLINVKVTHWEYFRVFIVYFRDLWCLELISQPWSNYIYNIYKYKFVGLKKKSVLQTEKITSMMIH